MLCSSFARLPMPSLVSVWANFGSASAPCGSHLENRALAGPPRPFESQTMSLAVSSGDHAPNEAFTSASFH